MQNSNSNKLEDKLLDEKNKHFNAKAFIADTLTMIVYSTPIAMCNEMTIMDMSFYESFSARTGALPVNFLTSRPYGKYRNFLFEKFEITEKSNPIKKALTEVFAFGSFQAPLYALITGTTKVVSKAIDYNTSLFNYETWNNSISNVDWSNVGTGVLTITLLSPIIGPTYGWVNDKVRKYFNVPVATEHK